jgi:hypothetical protein
MPHGRPRFLAQPRRAQKVKGHKIELMAFYREGLSFYLVTNCRSICLISQQRSPKSPLPPPLSHEQAPHNPTRAHHLVINRSPNRNHRLTNWNMRSHKKPKTRINRTLHLNSASVFSADQPLSHQLPRIHKDSKRTAGVYVLREPHL